MTFDSTEATTLSIPVGDLIRRGDYIELAVSGDAFRVTNVEGHTRGIHTMTIRARHRWRLIEYAHSRLENFRWWLNG